MTPPAKVCQGDYYLANDKVNILDALALASSTRINIVIDNQTNIPPIRFNKSVIVFRNFIHKS